MELLQASFALINFPFTLLVIIVVLYWTSVILGALDISVLDFSMDADGLEGSDVGDVGELGEGSGGDAGGALRAVLQYLFIGEVPLTIILSLLFVSLWAFSVLFNYYVNPHHSYLLAAALLIPNVLVSAHIARFAAAPLRKLFRAIDRDAQTSVNLVGRRCRVLTSRVTPDFGQAELETDGAPICLSVRTHEGETLPQGAEAVILEAVPEKSLYIITGLELDEEKNESAY